MAKKKQELIEQAMMTHIVLLQLKPEISDQTLASLWKAAHALQQHIPCLLSVSAGENQSTGHWGFTHGILLHFTDEQHLRDGMTHPPYQRLREKIQPLCEQIISFDIQERIPFALSRPELSSPPSTPPTKRDQEQQKTSVPHPGARRSIDMSDLLRKYPVKEIHPRIKQIVMDQLGVDENEVIPSASLVEDLNADSLDLVEYIMTLEATFNIEISDEEAEIITTVGETQAYLMEKGAL